MRGVAVQGCIALAVMLREGRENAGMSPLFLISSNLPARAFSRCVRRSLDRPPELADAPDAKSFLSALLHDFYENEKTAILSQVEFLQHHPTEEEFYTLVDFAENPVSVRTQSLGAPDSPAWNSTEVLNFRAPCGKVAGACICDDRILRYEAPLRASASRLHYDVRNIASAAPSNVDPEQLRVQVEGYPEEVLLNFSLSMLLYILPRFQEKKLRRRSSNRPSETGALLGMATSSELQNSLNTAPHCLFEQWLISTSMRNFPTLVQLPFKCLRSFSWRNNVHISRMFGAITGERFTVDPNLVVPSSLVKPPEWTYCDNCNNRKAPRKQNVVFSVAFGGIEAGIKVLPLSEGGGKCATGQCPAMKEYDKYFSRGIPGPCPLQTDLVVCTGTGDLTLHLDVPPPARFSLRASSNLGAIWIFLPRTFHGPLTIMSLLRAETELCPISERGRNRRWFVGDLAAWRESEEHGDAALVGTFSGRVWVGYVGEEEEAKRAMRWGWFQWGVSVVEPLVGFKFLSWLFMTVCWMASFMHQQNVFGLAAVWRVWRQTRQTIHTPIISSGTIMTCTGAEYEFWRQKRYWDHIFHTIHSFGTRAPTKEIKNEIRGLASPMKAGGGDAEERDAGESYKDAREAHIFCLDV
ncbi:hypothetical protein B0H19DRAFT_1055496 [Mycena capillaripes]|nr:hypothetical protein B0H19DRAFT_1055496 [Mycena capillaripes]